MVAFYELKTLKCFRKSASYYNITRRCVDYKHGHHVFQFNEEKDIS